MSEVTLTIRDDARAVTGRIHGCVAQASIGALTAEPETIEELTAAMGRYFRPHGPGWPLVGFADDVSDEPWDAGLVLIDLPARLCVAANSFWRPERAGHIPYHDGRQATDLEIPYQLPSDWLVVERADGWGLLAAERRAEFATRQPLDWRTILYGRLPEALVDVILDPSLADTEDVIQAAHAHWLVTPRDDLAGRAPRDWLLARHDDLIHDLEARAWQWGCLGECPPELPRDSAAFRLGGCGPHERVLYYELTRHLLAYLRQRRRDALRAHRPAVIAQLAELRDQWLAAPQADELHGLTPQQVIDQERVRRPWAISADQAIIDHDCPLCRMMAEDLSGPMFCHLDDTNFDNEFAFSRHPTRAEWEEEQREWEEFTHRVVEEPKVRIDDSDVWQSSSCNVPLILNSPPSQPRIGLLMFGLAAHLAELDSDVRRLKLDPLPLRRAMTEFDDLRTALLENADWLYDIMTSRCVDALQALSQGAEPLRPKCQDLIRKFHVLRQLCAESGPVIGKR